MSKSPFICFALLMAAAPLAALTASSQWIGEHPEAEAVAAAETTSGLQNAPLDLTPMNHAIEMIGKGFDNSVSIEQKEALPSSVKELTLISSDWTQAAQPRSEKNKSAKAGVSAKAPTFSDGYYIYKNWPTNAPNSFESGAIRFIERNDSLIMNNIGGFQTDAVLENENGLWTLPAQRIYSHKTYGDVYICPINLSNNTYDPEGTIAMTMNSKGEATLTAWGLFITEGEYKNSCFGAYSKSNWIPSNASVQIRDINDDSFSYPMLIEQPYANRLYLYNMVGFGGYIEATITPSKTLKITPQQMFYNSMMGPAFCYAADWTSGKIKPAENITGSLSGADLLLNDWAICWRASQSSSILQAKETTIKTSASIAWPEALQGSFAGSGSEADPWLIKTADDMMLLSQRVEGGESFSGKTFALAGNVSLGGLKRAWEPIGDATTPFEGTFLGKGFTVKDLTANGRGSNLFGLFGRIGAKGTIDGLNISDFTLNGTGDCIGLLAGASEGAIKNCKVNGTLITNGLQAAGIVAQNRGSISGCSVSGTISGAGNVGSIAAESFGSISDCYSYASVISNGYLSSTYRSLGGLVGSLYPSQGTEATLTDSYFAGTLTDNAGYSYSGGVVGMMIMAKVERCFNVGMINAKRVSPDSDNATGGVVGAINDSKMTDCFNAGTIIKKETSEYVGGIIGYISCTYSSDGIKDVSEIKNCYNSGYISSTSAATHKGVFGGAFYMQGLEPDKIMLSNCFFDSQVTGLEDEYYGRPSSFFLSSRLPEGFSSEVWHSVPHLYPQLDKFADTTAGALAASAMEYKDGELCTKVKKDVSLSSRSPITWKIMKNGQFVTKTDALSISSVSLKIGNDYGNELVVATTEDGTCLKAYYVSVVPAAFQGEGTAESPYIVKDVNDFKTLHRAVATFGQAHTGDFFKLNGDINLGKTTEFNGVGVGSSYAFGGTFDGDGHTLSGLRVHAVARDASGAPTAKGSYNYGALFAVLSPKATVKNLTIAADCDYDGWGYTGAIAGHNAGKIENCRNYADINAIYQYAGGICGYVASTGSVEGCYNSGSINVGYEQGGGIAGANSGSISLSQNDGKVAVFHRSNVVSATGLKSGAGGIVGINFGLVEKSVNNATVEADRYVGGIVGTNSSGAKAGSIVGCLSNGIVNCRGDYDSKGAIIGYRLSKGELTNNWYDQSINPFGPANSIGLRGINGINTGALVSGNKLEGIDADKFDFTSGMYPVLKQFSNEDACRKLRAMYIKFGEGEIRTNVIKSVDLSSPLSISWKLRKNEAFTLAGKKLNVVQPTELVVATDTLTATLGNYTKVYPLASIPNVLDGRGTEDNPFLIRTTADFNKLSNFIESSKMDYNGFFFRLESDLDFSSTDFKPIALGNLKFQGDFNGNGKKLSGFKYEDVSVADGKGRYIGLFGTIGEAGRVHDLTLSDCLFSTNGYSGAFAGKLYGKIENCVSAAKVEVSKANYAGGFAGIAYADSEITGCTFKGNVKGIDRSDIGGFIGGGTDITISNSTSEGTVEGTAYLGGFAGSMSGTLDHCVNKSTFVTPEKTGSTYIGGLVAYGSGLGSGKLTLTDCTNESDIKILGTYIAGLVCTGDGFNLSTKVSGCYMELTNCTNNGKLTAGGYLAGLVYNLGSGMNISGCVNNGSVTATNGGYAAGMFGSLGDDINYEVNRVYNCENLGDVTSSGRNNGGFCVSIDNGVTVENCRNYGNVTTTYQGTNSNQAFTGGFSANASGHVVRCMNAGNVTSMQFGVSGFASYGSGVIEKCVNLGDVTCTDSQTPSANFGSASGFFSQGQNTLIDCINFGTIKGVNRVAALHAAAWNGTTITNCYNVGKVIVTGSSKAQSDVIAVPRRNVLSGETRITNCFYDVAAVEGQNLPNAYNAKGMTEDELRDAPLGDGFYYNRAALPTIDGMLKPERMHFAAARYDIAGEGETAENLRSHLYLPFFSTLQWTSEQDVVFSEPCAYPQKVGEFSILCTAPESNLSKSFKFNLTYYGSVDEIAGGREVLSMTYYDLSGRIMSAPIVGTPMIVVSRYADGTSETRRVIITK